MSRPKRSFRLTDEQRDVAERNIGLVTTIAAQFRDDRTTVSERVQEGFLGLSRAVVGFSAARNPYFTTYATPAIRNAIMRSPDNDGVIRRPIHVRRLQTQDSPTPHVMSLDGAWIEDASSPFEEEDDDALSQIAVQDAMSQLTDQEQDVIRGLLLYGDPIGDVAERHGLSTSQVRAIKRKAVSWIKTVISDAESHQLRFSFDN